MSFAGEAGPAGKLRPGLWVSTGERWRGQSEDISPRSEGTGKKVRVRITLLPPPEGKDRQGPGAGKRSTWGLHGTGLRSPFYSADTETRGEGTGRAEELKVLEQLHGLVSRAQHLL